jgi:hypothetical protein
MIPNEFQEQEMELPENENPQKMFTFATFCTNLCLFITNSNPKTILRSFKFELSFKVKEPQLSSSEKYKSLHKMRSILISGISMPRNNNN